MLKFVVCPPRSAKPRRFLWLAILALIWVISNWALSGWAAQPESDYTLSLGSEFNRPDYFPISQNLNPQQYQPVAPWQGRLILPPTEANPTEQTDWVWVEILHAPPGQASLVGQKLRLEWVDHPEVKAAVQAVTKDVQFTAATQTSIAQGNLHPTRLNGRRQVGPLQSLAGAHPIDDVTVALEAVTLKPTAPGGQPILQVATEPLVTGRYYSLVKIIAPMVNPKAIPAACPGVPPCPNQTYQVQHYNRQTQQFDGPKEVVWIPQVLPGRNQLFASTSRDLADSPAGTEGWYLYGGQNRQGQFVVQAIMPRRLLQLPKQPAETGLQPGMHYLKQRQWQQTPNQKGQLSSVQLLPTPISNSPWQLGDHALLLHSFGGIGGRKAEATPLPGTVTGHFSYGWATVIREPLTNEFQFDLQYQQIYAHNPNGIIAGRQTWATYMGHLQRGWLGTRPVSDILVKFAPISQDYQFPGLRFSPQTELNKQLQIMAARYRIGDGTGAALVNPAQSCVQDSSQAVFITMNSLQEKIQANPIIATWLQTHPQDDQTKKFQQLQVLRDALAGQVSPFRIVRSDWQQNADTLTGIASDSGQGFTQAQSLWNQILSWRTVVPRVAHDQLATTFLQQGGILQVLRTNQVGGHDPDILPLAPTQLLEGTPIPYVFSRTLQAITAPLTGGTWGWGLAGLLAYGVVSFLWGHWVKFLSWQPMAGGVKAHLQLALHTFIAPALLEEWIFRVGLLPHPSEAVAAATWWSWAGLGLAAFIIYHPLNAWLFYPPGRSTFWQWQFLSLAAGLGLACTGVYALTGSLWLIILIHWLVVYVWLAWLGGKDRLSQSELANPRPVK